ncbi:hypothetical protein BGZ46_003478, partial [Entomortierella lignicola]
KRDKVETEIEEPIREEDTANKEELANEEGIDGRWPKRNVKPVYYAEEDSSDDGGASQCSEGSQYTPITKPPQAPTVKGTDYFAFITTTTAPALYEPRSPLNLDHAGSSVPSDKSKAFTNSTMISDQHIHFVDYGEEPLTEYSDEANADPQLSTTPTSKATSSTVPLLSVPSSSSKRTKADKPFTKKNRLSLNGRYHGLKGKWVLASGTVVEDILYAAGSDKDCASVSFMLDLDDARTKALFTEEDWKEIISDLPRYENYGEEASRYLDMYMEVTNIEDMRKILEKRQYDPECKILYHAMDQW